MIKLLFFEERHCPLYLTNQFIQYTLAIKSSLKSVGLYCNIEIVIDSFDN